MKFKGSFEILKDLSATKLDIDNISIDGSSIVSSNVNGDINITPNGTGNLVLDGLKFPQADGSANYYLKTNGSGQLSWSAITGTGDVVGPSSSTDHAVARFDLTTGKLIQNSVVIADDSGNVTGVGTLTATTVNSTTFDTNVSASKLQISGTSITAAGSDTDVNITLNSKGAGGFIFDGVSSGYSTSQWVHKQAVLAQTSDVYDTIASIPVAVSTCAFIKVYAVSRHSATTYSIAAEVFGAARRVTSDVTLMGQIQNIIGNGLGTYADDVQLTANTGTQAIDIQVKSLGTGTYYWVCNYSYSYINTNT